MPLLAAQAPSDSHQRLQALRAGSQGVLIASELRALEGD